MKKVFSLVFVAMMAVAASAQVTWNVKGGIGVATCYGEGDDGLSNRNHFVGKLGAGIEYPLTSNLSLMPSLELAWKGYKLIEDKSPYYFEDTCDLFYVQIPVMAAYRVGLAEAWNMTLKAGPYFAFNVSDHYSYVGRSDHDHFYNDSGSLDAEKFDVGLDLGIDFEYHRFVFGAEVELGFINLTKDEEGAKNLAFYATVGYKF